MQVGSTLFDFNSANIGKVTIGRQDNQILGIGKIKCHMFCTGQSPSINLQLA